MHKYIVYKLCMQQTSNGREKKCRGLRYLVYCVSRVDDWLQSYLFSNTIIVYYVPLEDVKYQANNVLFTR